MQKLFNPTHLILHEETEDESAKWFAQKFAAWATLVNNGNEDRNSHTNILKSKL